MKQLSRACTYIEPGKASELLYLLFNYLDKYYTHDIYTVKRKIISRTFLVFPHNLFLSLFHGSTFCNCITPSYVFGEGVFACLQRPRSRDGGRL